MTVVLRINEDGQGVDSIEIGKYDSEHPIDEDAIERETRGLQDIEGFISTGDAIQIAREINDCITRDINLDSEWQLGFAGNTYYALVLDWEWQNQPREGETP